MRGHDKDVEKKQVEVAPVARRYTVWRFVYEFVVEAPFMSLMFIGTVWLLVRNSGIVGAAKFFGVIGFLIILSGVVPLLLRWMNRRFPRFSDWVVIVIGIIGLLALVTLFVSAILDPTPPCNRFDDSGC